MNTRILVDSILWTNRREGHGRSLPSSKFTEVNHSPCIERHTRRLQLQKTYSVTLLLCFGMSLKTEPSQRLLCGARSPMVIIGALSGPCTLWNRGCGRAPAVPAQDCGAACTVEKRDSDEGAIHHALCHSTTVGENIVCRRVPPCTRCDAPSRASRRAPESRPREATAGVRHSVMRRPITLEAAGIDMKNTRRVMTVVTGPQ